MQLDPTFANYEMVKYLESKDVELFANVKWLYGICYNLLLEIPKTFSNYTIHDINHSIRVIGYMNDFVKDHLDKYSCLHIAFMIYVGLLHDTGMVVSDEEKEKLYCVFEEKNPEFEKMDEHERLLYLQDYIRNNHGKRVREVLEHKVDDNTKIKSRLSVGDTGAYDISDIVADICQAHMEDSEWISKNLYGTKTFGKYQFNAQQIAVLLRIGDALDIDDRRAPYVLFNMLRIKGYSAGEWKKHIPITNYQKIFTSDGGKTYSIYFEGKCNDYAIYQKVSKYIDDVETWLEKDASFCTGDYALNIQLPINKNIQSDEFEETPLQFSLNYKQITKLLMGEKIYGSKQEGLRELLQNAIDAVLLMKDIKEEKPHNCYKPIVGIEIKKNQIAVFDNGIGMSEDVLKNFFFNIGTSYYDSREFNSRGYNYSPIGHFGIGFMACFMLSSRITLETKHYTEGSKLIRMSFDKESYNVIRYKVNRKSFDFDHGTKIIMDYDQIIPDVFSDVASIENYVRELLVANDFEFYISNPRDRKVKLEKLKLQYINKDEKEEMEYEYSTDETYRIINNVETFFNGIKRDPYLLDYKIIQKSDEVRDNYHLTTVSIFMRHCRELNRRMQLELDDSFWQVDDLVQYTAEFGDAFFRSFVIENAKAMLKYFYLHKDIVGYCLFYLSSYIQENRLIWYDYPTITDANRFAAFLKLYDSIGLEKALEEFKNQVFYTPVLCKERDPDSDDILSIIQDVLIQSSFIDVQVPLSLEYYDQYPIMPLRRGVRLIQKEDSYNFLAVRRNYREFGLKIYLKGIRVADRSFALPYAIAGINIKEILINLKSNRFELDVARSSFVPGVKEDIENMMACAIYEDIRKKRTLIKEEKDLVDMFLQKYYRS